MKRNYPVTEKAYVKVTAEDGTEQFVETEIQSYKTEDVNPLQWIMNRNNPGPVNKEEVKEGEKKESHLVRNIAIGVACVGAAALGVAYVAGKKDDSDSTPTQIPNQQVPQLGYVPQQQIAYQPETVYQPQTAVPEPVVVEEPKQDETTFETPTEEVKEI